MNLLVNTFFKEHLDRALVILGDSSFLGPDFGKSLREDLSHGRMLVKDTTLSFFIGTNFCIPGWGLSLVLVKEDVSSPLGRLRYMSLECFRGNAVSVISWEPTQGYARSMFENADLQIHSNSLTSYYLSLRDISIFSFGGDPPRISLTSNNLVKVLA